MLVCAIAGAVIGLPTLRLRGDYIAIVTLAFGEIVGRFMQNGEQVEVISGYALSNGRESISPLDQIDLPFLAPFDSATNLRPVLLDRCSRSCSSSLLVNIRLRDSRLGRAWIALREDEVAAASMGVPLVKTKLTAYATGGAFGGIAGAFYGAYLNSVNANQFQFGFSIFILAMVILGGLGSIWGVVIGAVALAFVNNRLIPDVLDQGAVNDFKNDLGLEFTFSEMAFGIFGFVLVLMMVLRPAGHPARAPAPDRAHRGSPTKPSSRRGYERRTARDRERPAWRSPRPTARCSPPTGSARRSAGSWRSATSRSPWRRSRSSRSSARTAPARPPSSTC